MALPKPLAAFTPFLRQPGPRALLAGNAISRFGDALDTVAFGWLVYRLTGSTLMMGMLYTVNALPGLIFGLAGGLLADRRPPARTFALLCALRGALVMLIAVLALLERCPVYMLFVFTALNSTCEALGSPAAQKLPSLLLPTPALDGYLGLQQGLQTGAELLGYAVSGLVIALLGMGHTLLVDAATFLACAALVLRAGRYAQPAPQAAQQETPRRALLEGRPAHPPRRAAGNPGAVRGLCDVDARPLQRAQHRLRRHGARTRAGDGRRHGRDVHGGHAAGRIARHAALRRRAAPAPDAVHVAAGHRLRAAGAAAAAARLDGPAADACGLRAGGTGLPVAITTVQAVTLRATPAHLRGRVLSLLLAVSYVSTPLGSAAAGVLGSLVALPALFGACGLMVLLCVPLLLLCAPLRRLGAPSAL